MRAATQEGRGRLKVFLGAAPGVGKTYEMLTEGATRCRGGVDAVIGVVETHGRAETEMLIGDLEIIPRRRIDYQSRSLTEMDIDAILERRPGRVLVDELVHSNASGSRHPKRYQDIEELLAAGIDVYSTVNIQHPESLNDVVASFTKVRVRETVPDRVLEEAELEVVDIPPDELIERLKEGKVYVPHEATRALSHFFSKSNLSALRELACGGRPKRSTRRCSIICALMPWAGLGPPTSASWSRSASCRARKGWSDRPNVSPTRCARPGRRSIVKRPAPPGLATKPVGKSRRRCSLQRSSEATSRVSPRRTSSMDLRLSRRRQGPRSW